MFFLFRAVRRLIHLAKSLCVVVLVYLCFSVGRFFYAQQNTIPADVLNGKDNDAVTVIYRPTCPRCQKTIPWLILREGLSTQKINVVNADEFTQDQRKALGVELLPTFLYEGKAYNTMDKSEIEALFETARNSSEK